MILTLDVGNTQIFGGVFDNDKPLLQFRKTSTMNNSSDELGIFFKNILRENNINPEEINNISVCSVVPETVHSVRNACIKYFNKTPFILKPGTKTGLRIKYKNPAEVGADRIANAIGATRFNPDKNLIIIDFGTANTFCAVSRTREYLGGVIVPGLRISMEALVKNTAKLPNVEIIPRKEVLGKTTINSIQSGLYHGNLAIIRDITQKIKNECFNKEETIVIGTGGFARLFENDKVFDKYIPDLVLIGLNEVLKMNL